MDRAIVVDVQNHIFPKSCVKLIREENLEIRIRNTSRGLVMYDVRTKENFNAIPAPLYSDLELRTKVLKKFGIDVAILSFPAPGPDAFGLAASVRLCKLINDEISRLSDAHPDMFSGMACIPFSDIPLALEEMERAVLDKGLKGIMTYNNIRGRFLDSREFYPIYRRAQKLGVPIYIHPTIPTTADVVGSDFGINLLLGWPFETGVSILRLALSGTLDFFKGVTFVTSHAGGIIPFCANRIETLYSAHARTMSRAKARSPLESLQRVFADLALYGSESATECALEFFSPERCLFATDYAYGPENGTVFLESAIRTVNQLPISDEDKRNILGQNAQRLFKIS